MTGTSNDSQRCIVMKKLGTSAAEYWLSTDLQRSTRYFPLVLGDGPDCPAGAALCDRSWRSVQIDGIPVAVTGTPHVSLHESWAGAWEEPARKTDQVVGGHIESLPGKASQGCGYWHHRHPGVCRYGMRNGIMESTRTAEICWPEHSGCSRRNLSAIIAERSLCRKRGLILGGRKQDQDCIRAPSPKKNLYLGRFEAGAMHSSS